MNIKEISAVTCGCSRLLDALASASNLPTPAVTIIDAKWRHRRVPLSHGRHFLTRVAIPGSGVSALVESDLEYRVAKSFLQCGDVHALISQPVTVWFLYRRLVHRYTPDLMVVMRNTPRTSRTLLIEVKPRARVADASELWQARRAALRIAFDLSLVVVTEDMIAANGGLAHE